VLFSTYDFTGQTLNNPITITALEPLFSDSNNLYAGGAAGITLQPVGGIAATNLMPGDYQVVIQGIGQAWFITVPFGTNLVNAAAIPKRGVDSQNIFFWTNALAGVTINLGGGGGSATNLTPWPSDINAAGYSLTNLDNVQMTGTLPATNLPGLLPALAGTNGYGLTNLNASNLSGMVPTNNLPGLLPSLSLANGAALTNLHNARIGFVGDSITTTTNGGGWSTNLLQQYPEFADMLTTNVAVAGYRTAWMLTNLVAITNWLAATAPQAVGYCWFEGGVNDGIYLTNITATESNIAAAWTAITNVGAVPVTPTLYQTGLSCWSTFLVPLNGWIRSNAWSYGAVIVDLQQTMADINVMSSDGIHPNALGDAFIARAVASSILQHQSVIFSGTMGTNRAYLGSEIPGALDLGAAGQVNVACQTDGSTWLTGYLEWTGPNGFAQPGYVGCGYDSVNDGFSVSVDWGQPTWTSESLFIQRQSGYVAISPYEGGVTVIPPQAPLDVISPNAAPSTTATPNGGLIVGMGSGGACINLGTYGATYEWLQSRYRTATNCTPFVLNPIGGYVGIGRTNPATELDVNGTVTATLFSGSLSGNATSATTAGTASTATYATSAGSASGGWPTTWALSALQQSGASAGQLAQWNGSAWAPFTLGSYDPYGAAQAATNGLNAAAFTGVASSGWPTSWALSALQQSGASLLQVPQWNGSSWVPATVSGSGAAATNALSMVESNGTVVATGATNLNLSNGTNTTLSVNGASGTVNLSVNVPTGSFDAAGAAQAATNGLGAAAWQPVNHWDLAGAGAAAALAATNAVSAALVEAWLGFTPEAATADLAGWSVTPTNLLTNYTFTAGANVTLTPSASAGTLNLTIAAAGGGSGTAYVTQNPLTNSVYGTNVTSLGNATNLGGTYLASLTMSGLLTNTATGTNQFTGSIEAAGFMGPAGVASGVTVGNVSGRTAMLDGTNSALTVSNVTAAFITSTNGMTNTGNVYDKAYTYFGSTGQAYVDGSGNLTVNGFGAFTSTVDFGSSAQSYMDGSGVFHGTATIASSGWPTTWALSSITGTGTLPSWATLQTNIFDLAGAGTTAALNATSGLPALVWATIGTGLSLSGGTLSATGSGTLAAGANGTNVWLGVGAMQSVTNGQHNAGVGDYSLANVTSGSHNAALGYAAGQGVTTGSYNTILGDEAANNLQTGSGNTILGPGANVSSSSIYGSVAIGTGAVATANNQIMLGGPNVTSVTLGAGTLTASLSTSASVPSSTLTGALPAVSGASLTGLTGANVTGNVPSATTLVSGAVTTNGTYYASGTSLSYLTAWVPTASYYYLSTNAGFTLTIAPPSAANNTLLFFSRLGVTNTSGTYFTITLSGAASHTAIVNGSWASTINVTNIADIELCADGGTNLCVISR
jgi:hypothetical protein